MGERCGWCKIRTDSCPSSPTIPLRHWSRLRDMQVFFWMNMKSNIVLFMLIIFVILLVEIFRIKSFSLHPLLISIVMQEFRFPLSLLVVTWRTSIDISVEHHVKSPQHNYMILQSNPNISNIGHCDLKNIALDRLRQVTSVSQTVVNKFEPLPTDSQS